MLLLQMLHKHSLVCTIVYSKELLQQMEGEGATSEDRLMVTW